VLLHFVDNVSGYRRHPFLPNATKTCENLVDETIEIPMEPTLNCCQSVTSRQGEPLETTFESSKEIHGVEGFEDISSAPSKESIEVGVCGKRVVAAAGEIEKQMSKLSMSYVNYKWESAE
jgi:hypothetical protein